MLFSLITEKPHMLTTTSLVTMETGECDIPALCRYTLFYWIRNELLSLPQKGWLWRQRCYLVRYTGLNNWLCCIRFLCLLVTSPLSFHRYRVCMDKIRAWFVSDTTPRCHDYVGERQRRVGSDCEWRYIRVASLPWYCGCASKLGTG